MEGDSGSVTAAFRRCSSGLGAVRAPADAWSSSAAGVMLIGWWLALCGVSGAGRLLVRGPAGGRACRLRVRVDVGLGLSGDCRRSASGAPALQDRDGVLEREGDHAERACGADAGVVSVDAVVGADGGGLRRFDGRRGLAGRLRICGGECLKRTMTARWRSVRSCGEIASGALKVPGSVAASRASGDAGRAAARMSSSDMSGVCAVSRASGCDGLAVASRWRRWSSRTRVARTRWSSRESVGRWTWWPPGRSCGTAGTLERPALRRLRVSGQSAPWTAS
jgi:hypothetical protein